MKEEKRIVKPLSKENKKLWAKITKMMIDGLNHKKPIK